MESLILTLAFSTLIAILYYVIKRFVEKMLLNEQLLYIDTYLVFYPIFENIDMMCNKYSSGIINSQENYEFNADFFRFEVYAKFVVDLLYKLCIYYNYDYDKINNVLKIERVAHIFFILKHIDKNRHTNLFLSYSNKFIAFSKQYFNKLVPFSF